VLLAQLVCGSALAQEADPAAIPAETVVAPSPGWPSLNRVLALPAWVDLELELVAEPLAGAAPGQSSAGVWMQQLALSAEFSRGLARPKASWQELDHWKLALQLTGFSGNPDLNQLLGTAFPLQTTAHPTGLWLSEASLQRSAAGGEVFVKAGLMPLNPGFIEAEVLNSYIHSAFNNTLNLTINGLPINPFVAPAASVHLRLGSSSELRLGSFWLDSVNNLAGLFGVNPGQAPSSGSLQIVQWNLRDLPGSAALQGPIRQGNRLVARQLPPPLLQLGGFNTTGPSGTPGVYGTLTLAAPLPVGLDHRLWLGFNNGFSPQSNPTPRFVAGGWLAQGLLRSRPLDVLAVAFGSTWFSSALNPGLNPESVLELNYTVPLNSQLAIQPVLQWILQPGGSSQRSAVVAAGLQLTLSF
jgi:porin